MDVNNEQPPADVIQKENPFQISSIDYRQVLGSSRVMFLGEDHKNIPAREHLLTRLSEMKTLGITHYGIEARNDHPEIFERLNNGEEVDLSEVDIGPVDYSRRLEYEKLIRGMVKSGIKVVPIDPDKFDPRKRPHSSTEKREQAIYEKINEILDENASNKVLILIGIEHIKKQTPLFLHKTVHSAASRLVSNSVAVSTARFTGGLGSSPDLSDLDEHIRINNLASMEFMIPGRQVGSSLGQDFNYLLHVPRKQLEDYKFG